MSIRLCVDGLPVAERDGDSAFDANDLSRFARESYPFSDPERNSVSDDVYDLVFAMVQDIRAERRVS